MMTPLARRLCVASITACVLSAPGAAQARTIRVSTTIQAAVDAAVPGDTVQVPRGVYRENVGVNKDSITIQGPPTAVLDGTGLPGSSGIRVAPQAPATRIHRFQLNGLRIQNFSRNGAVLIAVDDFVVRNGVYSGNAAYGVFPIRCSRGVVEGNVVSGSDDSGLYIGQSDHVAMRGNVCYDNTTGIEIENSTDIVAAGNLVTGNTLGISAFVIPGLASTTTDRVLLAENLVLANNRPNPVTDPDEIVSRLPSGTGILLIGADGTTITHNTVLGNDTIGIAVVQLPPDIASLDPRIDPFPDWDVVQGNWVRGNGRAPDPKIAPLPGVDLLWDGSGTGDRWLGNRYDTSFPAVLPN